MIYNITPCPAPRMTRADKWKKRPCVLKYFAFKEECRLKRVQYLNGQSIVFVMPMSQSWSKKKKAEYNNTPHKQIPDADNMIKALFDAIFEDDSHIWHIGNVKKIWGYEGQIHIF